MTKNSRGNSGNDPLRSLMKKGMQKSSDSAAKAKMNYKEALDESRKEKEEKGKEELDDARKNARAKMAASDTPELIMARFIQAIIKYSVISLLLSILMLGLVKAVPRLFKSSTSGIHDSLVN